MEDIDSDKKVVFIAGPFEGGDSYDHNIHNAIQAGEDVLDAGHIPFIPHTHTSLWSIAFPKQPDDWYDIDLHMLDRCDSLIRLEGDSEGATGEVEFALDNGIDVYYGVEEFMEEHGQ